MALEHGKSTRPNGQTLARCCRRCPVLARNRAASRAPHRDHRCEHTNPPAGRDAPGGRRCSASEMVASRPRVGPASGRRSRYGGCRRGCRPNRSVDTTRRRAQRSGSDAAPHNLYDNSSCRFMPVCVATSNATLPSRRLSGGRQALARGMRVGCASPTARRRIRSIAAPLMTGTRTISPASSSRPAAGDIGAGGRMIGCRQPPASGAQAFMLVAERLPPSGCYQLSIDMKEVFLSADRRRRASR
jgi:hypothetical protein